MRKVSTCTSPCAEDQRVPCAASRACGTSLVGRPMRTPVAGSTTTLQPNSSSCALAAATSSARSVGVSTPVILALLRFWKFLMAASIGSSPPVDAGDSRPTTTAPPGFSAARPAECRRARLEAPPWRPRAWPAGVRASGFGFGLCFGRFGFGGFACRLWHAALLPPAAAAAVPATAARLWLLRAALAAAEPLPRPVSRRLLCADVFLRRLGAVCFGIGMMPGESCASAGAAPSKSASITRNGPQRIVFNATLPCFAGTLAHRGERRKASKPLAETDVKP